MIRDRTTKLRRLAIESLEYRRLLAHGLGHHFDGHHIEGHQVARHAKADKMEVRSTPSDQHMDDARSHAGRPSTKHHLPNLHGRRSKDFHVQPSHQNKAQQASGSNRPNDVGSNRLLQVAVNDAALTENVVYENVFSNPVDIVFGSERESVSKNTSVSLQTSVFRAVDATPLAQNLTIASQDPIGPLDHAIADVVATTIDEEASSGQVVQQRSDPTPQDVDAALIEFNSMPDLTELLPVELAVSEKTIRDQPRSDIDSRERQFDEISKSEIAESGIDLLSSDEAKLNVNHAGRNYLQSHNVTQSDWKKAVHSVSIDSLLPIFDDVVMGGLIEMPEPLATMLTDSLIWEALPSYVPQVDAIISRLPFIDSDEEQEQVDANSDESNTSLLQKAVPVAIVVGPLVVRRIRRRKKQRDETENDSGKS